MGNKYFDMIIASKEFRQLGLKLVLVDVRHLKYLCCLERHGCAVVFESA